ncbi:MAG: hypothetical protein JNL10_11185 [Verrucomicrobiales bacterium]|nr:hypothetical protein [Verrucomicrobiales bacterium]
MKTPAKPRADLRVVCAAILVGGLGLTSTPRPLLAAEPRFALTGSVLGNGGTRSTGSGRFTLTGTLAQAEAAPRSVSPDRRFSIEPGFWTWAGVVQVPGSPLLRIRLENGNAVLAWPGATRGFILQEAGDLGGEPPWSPVVSPVVDLDGDHTVTVPAGGPPRWFRLVHP